MLVKENIQDIYTLSPLQEGMFFHALQEPSSIAYFEQQSFRQAGNLNIQNVEKSLNELFKRYDVLRTVFIFKKEKPLQIVLKRRSAEFVYEDISGKNDVENYLKNYKEKDKIRFFDLSKDVLMRVAVLQIDDEQFELIWSWHHILMDAWCVGILKNEFFEIYNSFQEERHYILPAPPPYRNFIKWLEQKDKQEAKDFWTEYLSDFKEISTLPKVNTVKSPVYQKEECSIVLDRQETDFFLDLTRNQKVTLSSIILTIWGILLSKYNNSKDVIFGSVVSGRPAEIIGIESMVGLFINTLPVRIKYDRETTFIELLKHVQLETLQRERFNYCSLSEIQAQSEVKIDLINHILLFQNFLNASTEIGMIESSNGNKHAKELQTLNVESFEQYFYDFNIFIIPGELITVLIKYNGKVYNSHIVINILNHLRLLVAQIKSDLNILISNLTLISSKEKYRFLKENDDSLVSYSKPLSLKELFEEQANKTPFSDAITFQGATLSYYELNNLSNNLAHYLVGEHSIGPNDLVGIMLERSERLIIAILSILKAGAAFIPIDPSTPIERKKHILKNSDLKLVLTDFYLTALIEEVNVKFVALDIQLYYLEENEINQSTINQNSDLAYVIYTSGSTGNPKGVKVTYGNFLNYILWANEFYFKNENGKNFPLFTSLAFDLTLTSIFSTLLRGDKLFICEGKEVQEDLKFIFREETEITAVKLTPAHISLLGHLELKKTNIEYAIIGGEALSNEQVKILKSLNPDIRIFNEYGPTEATVGCTVKRIENADELITIGKPIYNTKIFILDDDLNLQPEGITGEIYISGKGVALGYLKDPELTDKKFINNPFIEGDRTYRSGDLGRWLINGEIELLGRRDDQVKIRGYRIELGEIEYSIMKYSAINEAVVIHRYNKDEAYLVAYLTSGLEVNIDDLRAFLASSIPEFMIPGFFIQLDSLPLNNNGKINKNLLPSVAEFLRPAASDYNGPGNPVEEKLISIWKEILGADQIGVYDKFFDLGGHSLKAIQIIARIHKELNVKIEIRDIFDHQTINKIASIILESQEVTYHSVPVLEEQEYYDVSPAQKRLLIAQQLDEGSAAYNIHKGYIFNGALDIEALEKSFLHTIQRHESLRTRFISIKGVSKQKVQNSIEFKLDYTDLRGEDIEVNLRIKEVAEKEAYTPFALLNGPHMRAKLLHIDEERYVFFLTLHHIISDKQSNEILINEILTLYKIFTDKTSISLKPLKIHYKDFAAWQNNELKDESLEKYKQYWHSKFLREIPVLNFPTDYPRPNKRSFNGGIEYVRVDNELVKDLAQLSQENGTSPFVIHLACLKALIYRYTGQTDIIIGTVVSGREHSDLENQIGFYMNTLALRTKFNKTDEFKELFLKVQETTIGALQNQLYPFEQLIETLEISRDKNRSPLFDIVLSFQSNESENTHPEIEGVYVESLGIEKNATVFDLIVDVAQGENELSLSLIYNVDLFSEVTIQQFGKNYLILLQNIIKDINIKINDIIFSSHEEKQEEAERSIKDLFNLNF